MNLPDRLKKLRECAEKATPGPWRWRDRYDFREHLEHQKQGLDADCENIEVGRISLEPNVLSDWAEYADDSGLTVSKEDAAHIAAMNPATTLKLLDLIERQREALEYARVTIIGSTLDSALKASAMAREALAFDPFSE